MAYTLMTEKNLVEYSLLGEKEKKIGYKPNYDEMIEKSSCEEEAEAWRGLKNLPYDFAFAFRFVGSYKNKCGHWEIIQHPFIDDCQTAEGLNNELVEECKERLCTRCACNIGR